MLTVCSSPCAFWKGSGALLVVNVSGDVASLGILPECGPTAVNRHGGAGNEAGVGREQESHHGCDIRAFADTTEWM